MQPSKWHLAKILWKIKAIAKKLKAESSPEERLILRIRREILAMKKHIVFLENIIKDHENKKAD